MFEDDSATLWASLLTGTVAPTAPSFGLIKYSDLADELPARTHTLVGDSDVPPTAPAGAGTILAAIARLVVAVVRWLLCEQLAARRESATSTVAVRQMDCTILRGYRIVPFGLIRCMSEGENRE